MLYACQPPWISGRFDGTCSMLLEVKLPPETGPDAPLKAPVLMSAGLLAEPRDGKYSYRKVAAPYRMTA